MKSADGIGLRQQGISFSPFPVSPSGGKPGREGSPHAGSTLRGQQKALARIVRRLPPQEGCRPLVHPLRAPRAELGNLRDNRSVQFGLQQFCGAVYTKYLTLPNGPTPRASLLRQPLRWRVWGLLLFSLGLYLLSLERVTIAKTGHSGRKSAAVPLIICMGAAFAVDPSYRRPAIAATMMVLGFAAGVAWFFLWG